MAGPKFIDIDGKRFVWRELLSAAANSWRRRQESSSRFCSS